MVKELHNEMAMLRTAAEEEAKTLRAEVTAARAAAEAKTLRASASNYYSPRTLKKIVVL